MYVRAAEYRAPVLRFVVLKGTPTFAGNSRILCTQLPGRAAVHRDGVPWPHIEQEGGNLAITTDVDEEHVFDVRLNP